MTTGLDDGKVSLSYVWPIIYRALDLEFQRLKYFTKDTF